MLLYQHGAPLRGQAFGWLRRCLSFCSGTKSGIRGWGFVQSRLCRSHRSQNLIKLGQTDNAPQRGVRLTEEYPHETCVNKSKSYGAPDAAQDRSCARHLTSLLLHFTQRHDSVMT